MAHCPLLSAIDRLHLCYLYLLICCAFQAVVCIDRNEVAVAMKLFSARSKLQQRNGGDGGGRNQDGGASMLKEAAGRGKKHRDGKCRALCCGASSRLSVSSSVSWSSLEAPPQPPAATARDMFSLAHGKVQPRLQSRIDDAGARRSSAARRGTEPREAERRRWPCSCSCARGGGYYDKNAARERKLCVMLVAVERRTYEPLEEFRRSIAEVIEAKRMDEPAELRALLNCYMSVNAREHRAAILEAFYEVCSGLLSCKG